MRTGRSGNDVPAWAAPSRSMTKYEAGSIELRGIPLVRATCAAQPRERRRPDAAVFSLDGRVDCGFPAVPSSPSVIRWQVSGKGPNWDNESARSLWPGWQPRGRRFDSPWVHRLRPPDVGLRSRLPHPPSDAGVTGFERLMQALERTQRSPCSSLCYGSCRSCVRGGSRPMRGR